MERIFPAYYGQFRCIASACPDSCCKEWEVDVDVQSAARYRALSGPLGDRLRQVLRDTDEGTVMTIEDGRCPMWRQDGLCQIQAQMGHDALCSVCRTFPRLCHDYGDFAELGLELSCPETARLILTSPEQALLREAVPGGLEADYDTEAMAILRRSRGEVLSLLEQGTYTVPQILAILLLYACGVQTELDGGPQAVLCPEEDLQAAEKYAGSGDIAAVFEFFRELEILTPQWRGRLEDGPVHAAWTLHFRRLARYFVLRYWYQAVSDYDLISRAKLTVVACLLVNALGGDPVETAQLFSKEIENDPDNVEAILDGAYASPALTDINLLGLLLHPKNAEKMQETY